MPLPQPMICRRALHRLTPDPRITPDLYLCIIPGMWITPGLCGFVRRAGPVTEAEVTGCLRCGSSRTGDRHSWPLPGYGGGDSGPDGTSREVVGNFGQPTQRGDGKTLRA